MTTAAIKGRLHEYIEQADDKHLQAIYLLLEKELPTQYHYDAATLDMLYKRRENHLNESSETYSMEEALKLARKPADQ